MLDTIEKLCDEYDINLAISSRGENSSSHYGRLQEVLKLCDSRSRRIGVYGDLASWIRCGIDPIEAVRMLRDRLLILQVHDFGKLTGAEKAAAIFEEIHRLGVRPIMFSIEYPHDVSGSMSELGQSIDIFNRVSIEMAKRGEP